MMRNDDDRIAQLLRDVAAEMPADPELERTTLRRSRGRRVLNASLAGVTAVVLIAGSFAGLRLVAADPPAEPAGSPTPSSSIDTPTPPPDVPAAVSDTWSDIRTAVGGRDLVALERLVDPMLFFYNGSDQMDPLPEWRDDPSVLEPIPQILEMPFYVTPELEATDGFVGRFYQWPYLMEPGSLDDVSDEERGDLHALGSTDAEIQRMAEFGGYIGPRLVIREDGVWTGYFTGGD